MIVVPQSRVRSTVHRGNQKIKSARFASHSEQKMYLCYVFSANIGPSLSISSKKYFPHYLESVTNDKISRPASIIQPSCPNCHLFKCRFAKRHSRRRWLIIHVNRSLKRGRHRQRQMNERKTFIQNTSSSRVSSEHKIHSKNKYFSGESFRDSNSWRWTSNNVWLCFSHRLLLIRTVPQLAIT